MGQARQPAARAAPERRRPIVSDPGRFGTTLRPQGAAGLAQAPETSCGPTIRADRESSRAARRPRASTPADAAPPRRRPLRSRSSSPNRPAAPPVRRFRGRRLLVIVFCPRAYRSRRSTSFLRRLTSVPAALGEQPRPAPDQSGRLPPQRESAPSARRRPDLRSRRTQPPWRASTSSLNIRLRLSIEPATSTSVVSRAQAASTDPPRSSSARDAASLSRLGTSSVSACSTATTRRGAIIGRVRAAATTNPTPPASRSPVVSSPTCMRS